MGKSVTLSARLTVLLRVLRGFGGDVEKGSEFGIRELLEQTGLGCDFANAFICVGFATESDDILGFREVPLFFLDGDEPRCAADSLGGPSTSSIVRYPTHHRLTR